MCLEEEQPQRTWVEASALKQQCLDQLQRRIRETLDEGLEGDTYAEVIAEVEAATQMLFPPILRSPQL